MATQPKRITSCISLAHTHNAHIHIHTIVCYLNTTEKLDGLDFLNYFNLPYSYSRTISIIGDFCFIS